MFGIIHEKLTLITCILLFMAVSAINVFADEKEDRAKEHFFKGKALVEEGAYEKAIVELSASYELKPVPIVLYNIAVCYDELHRYADAIEYYRKFIETKEGSEGPFAKKVRERIINLSQFLGFLELEILPFGAEVLIDGRIVGKSPLKKLYIETGEHELRISKEGYQEIVEKVTVVSNVTLKRSYSLKKIEEEKQAKLEKGEGTEGSGGGEKGMAGEKRKKISPVAFYSIAGLSGALAITTALVGGFAIKYDNDLKSMSRWDDWKPVAQKRDNLALTADIMFGVTGASLISLITLYFFTDFKSKKGLKENHRADNLFKIVLNSGFKSINIQWRF